MKYRVKYQILNLVFPWGVFGGGGEVFTIFFLLIDIVVKGIHSYDTGFKLTLIKTC